MPVTIILVLVTSDVSPGILATNSGKVIIQRDGNSYEEVDPLSIK